MDLSEWGSEKAQRDDGTKQKREEAMKGYREEKREERKRLGWYVEGETKEKEREKKLKGKRVCKA